MQFNMQYFFSHVHPLFLFEKSHLIVKPYSPSVNSSILYTNKINILTYFNLVHWHINLKYIMAPDFKSLEAVINFLWICQEYMLWFIEGKGSFFGGARVHFNPFSNELWCMRHWTVTCSIQEGFYTQKWPHNSCVLQRLTDSVQEKCHCFLVPARIYNYYLKSRTSWSSLDWDDKFEHTSYEQLKLFKTLEDTCWDWL